MPEDGRYVLVHMTSIDHCEVGFYDHESSMWIYACDESVMGVGTTHWRPLPAPPRAKDPESNNQTNKGEQ